MNYHVLNCPRREAERVRFQRLHIWGSNNQVTAAKKELIRWTSSSQKSSNSGGNNPSFTKVRMDSEKKQKMLGKQMAVEAEKQKYRRAPEDSAVFVVHVSYLSRKAAHESDSCERSSPDHMRLTDVRGFLRGHRTISIQLSSSAKASRPSILSAWLIAATLHSTPSVPCSGCSRTIKRQSRKYSGGSAQL